MTKDNLDYKASPGRYYRPISFMNMLQIFFFLICRNEANSAYKM